MNRKKAGLGFRDEAKKVGLGTKRKQRVEGQLGNRHVWGRIESGFRGEAKNRGLGVNRKKAGLGMNRIERGRV